MVEKFLFKNLNIQIKLDLYVCLLIIVDLDLPLSLIYALIHIIVAAKLLYAQHWKTTQIPDV